MVRVLVFGRECCETKLFQGRLVEYLTDVDLFRK